MKVEPKKKSKTNPFNFFDGINVGAQFPAQNFEEKGEEWKAAYNLFFGNYGIVQKINLNEEDNCNE